MLKFIKSRPPDSMIVLEIGEAWYLVDKFDLTPMEQMMASEGIA